MARWKSAVMAIAIAGGGVFMLALLFGLLFERTQRARDRERYPPVGRQFDVGGRMMNIDCAGAGQPAVILESGANWAGGPAVRDPKTMYANGGPRPGYSWVPVQRGLAAVTTVCWYDRAGSGWSDPGPYPRDSASQARDLHALLGAAHVPAPYVLVGESSAVLDVRVYAGAYPAEVVGLVLVNSADPQLFLNPQSNNGKRAARIPEFVYHSQDTLAQVFNGVGLYRLGAPRPAPPPPPRLTADEWKTIWFLTHSSKAMSALMQDIASWRLSSEEARTAGGLGDRPLIVLTADNIGGSAEWVELWTKAQKELAQLSNRGRQIGVGGDARDLLYDAPDAIAAAVRQVISDAARRPTKDVR